MRNNKPHKLEIAMFLAAAAVLGFGIYFLGPAITGFVIREASYSNDINLVVAANGNYTLQLENTGELKSLKIDGRVTSYGRAKAYIESNGIRYLVFDSSKLNESKSDAGKNISLPITGFAANEDNENKKDDEPDDKESDKDKKEKNSKPKWGGPNEFLINGTAEINLSFYFSDKDNDELTFSVSEAENADVSLDDGIATIKLKTDKNFNTTINFIASDGVASTSEIVKIIGIAEALQDAKPNENHAPKWNSDVNSFTINGSTTINLSDYFIDEDNDDLTYSSGLADGVTIKIERELFTLIPDINYSGTSITVFVAFDGKNITSQLVNLIVPQNIADAAANKTKAINQTNESINNTQERIISINLSYNSGTVYDANDNGEESINGIVDLSATGTKFGWQADESRLCTRWEVYSAEDESLTTFCNGNGDCCAFLGLLPAKSNWSEVYYSSYGKDNAGHDNIVSGQVIYYDVNLSIDNPKSDIYNSGWGNLSVKFFEEEIEFANECLETCSLSGFNKSSIVLIFEIKDDAILRIDSVKYDLLADVANKAPVFVKNISTLNVTRNKNLTINLSGYFNDEDGDKLNYGYYPADNITITFEGGIATIVPDKGFRGIRYTYFAANDSDLSAVSDVFMLNVSEQFFRPVVEIGKPVKWEKTIIIDIENITSVNLSLPSSASNISITIINESKENNVSEEKIKIIEDGEVKGKGQYELEKKLSNIQRKISILEESKGKDDVTVSVDEATFTESEIGSKLDELYGKESSISSELNQLPNTNIITGNSVLNSITGNVVSLTEEIESINKTNPIMVINESLGQNIEVTVEYETEAPIAVGERINDYTKQVKIISETSYENVLSYTALNDVPQNAIKLYWVQNDERVSFGNVNYIDENNNNLIDRIEWVIPHLSNQTFEVVITVLNVQSYPTVGGNWTVGFNTSGTGNLSIYGYNGTTYAEVPDDSSTINDLEYLETRCNDAVLNTTIVCANGEQMPYEVYKIKKRIAEIKKRLNELNQSG